MGCRFYNKSISECKLLIVTSVKSIDEFYNNVIQDENEPQKQLFRRFKCCIVLDKEYAHYYAYNEVENTYCLDNRTVNPISMLYCPQTNKKYSEKFMEAMGCLPIDDDEYTRNLF